MNHDIRAITTLEYALIAALMTVLIGSAAQSMGAGMANKFQFTPDASITADSPLRASGDVVQE